MALEKRRDGEAMRTRGQRSRFSGLFWRLPALPSPAPNPAAAFSPKGLFGEEGKKLFSKEDGAPKEGKKNLWDGPGAKPAGCPFFGGGRKGRLFCF